MAQLPVCSVVAAADTKGTSLAVCKECEPTAQTKWLYMQPNELGSYSAEVGTTPRNPISLDRNNRKGTITSLTASPAFTSDTLMDMMRYFGDAYLYTVWKGADPYGLLPTAVTATGYTVPSGGAVPEGTLLYAVGWSNAANNGVKVAASGSTATEVKVAGLVAEAGNPAAQLHVAGIRPEVGDLQIDADGNLTSATLDFTTLGLTVGQMIHIGGVATANRFAQTDNYGLARVEAITTHLLTLGNTAAQYVADTGTGKAIDLFFGSFTRNVALDNADFLRTQFTMEARYNTNPVTYEYARAAFCNTLALSFPNEDKSTMELGFVAKDLEEPVTTRKLGASWDNMQQVTAFNTTSDFARLRITQVDGTGITTYFKDTTISIDNGVTPETVLGNLGAAFVNLGNFGVTLDTEVVMTDAAVLQAIRRNTTVSMTMGLRNSDGAFVVDLPSMTLGDGSKSLAVNEKIKITTNGSVFKDERLGYSMSISLFGYLPPDSL